MTLEPRVDECIFEVYSQQYRDYHLLFSNSLRRSLTCSPTLVLMFKRCGMGTLFVLVSPCFRENVVVTCKIGSFLCSSDNLLQKNVIVFFNGNKISKWRSFEIFFFFFTYFSHFLVTGEKLQKIPLAHISLTYIHVFC